MRNLIYILILLSCLGCSSSISIAGVSPSSFVMMKEYQKFWGSHLNPNGPMGTYIILDSTMNTFVAHDYASEEIGFWALKDDTLFLETQMRMWIMDTSLTYKRLDSPKVRQFVKNEQGEYYDEVTRFPMTFDISYLRRIRDTLKLKNWETLWEDTIREERVWKEQLPNLIILQKP